ncbi:hypothetical protein B0I35DRAFT_242906 [Stachybotrys elegans]|uniref:Uncharacterized protein n=1 Tax=Stachybotrys elegans TaxID=80388 RepID=A0A8K0SP26_9HYPO|nr:hypothetical protein B0I35DRAFT_242906 [Stachybotrys elegans]
MWPGGSISDSQASRPPTISHSATSSMFHHPLCRVGDDTTTQPFPLPPPSFSEIQERECVYSVSDAATCLLEHLMRFALGLPRCLLFMAQSRGWEGQRRAARLGWALSSHLLSPLPLSASQIQIGTSRFFPQGCSTLNVRWR